MNEILKDYLDTLENVLLSEAFGTSNIKDKEIYLNNTNPNKDKEIKINVFWQKINYDKYKKSINLLLKFIEGDLPSACRSNISKYYELLALKFELAQKLKLLNA